MKLGWQLVLLQCLRIKDVISITMTKNKLTKDSSASSILMLCCVTVAGGMWYRMQSRLFFLSQNRTESIATSSLYVPTSQIYEQSNNRPVRGVRCLPAARTYMNNSLFGVQRVLNTHRQPAAKTGALGCQSAMSLWALRIVPCISSYRLQLLGLLLLRYSEHIVTMYCIS